MSPGREGGALPSLFRFSAVYSAYLWGMSHEAVFDELCALLRGAGIEVRIEAFQRAPDRAGGLCVLKGKRLVLLDAAAHRSEQARALLETVENVGLEALGLRGAEFSPALRRQLGRRGKMPWPELRDAPGLARCDGSSPRRDSGGGTKL